jgi:hypothetical protein
VRCDAHIAVVVAYRFLYTPEQAAKLRYGGNQPFVAAVAGNAVLRAEIMKVLWYFDANATIYWHRWRGHGQNDGRRARVW